VRAPLVDLEVRGVPALTYFGTTLWTDAVFDALNEGGWAVCWVGWMCWGEGGAGRSCGCRGRRPLALSWRHTPPN
jgi:hypothetical protein